MTDVSTVPARIVVPIDDSQDSRRAIPLAKALAEPFDADVQTVTVADPSAVPAADVTLDGDTSDALCSYVTGEPHTIVCMASHGRSGLGRRLIGSTAEDLLRTCPVPVVVVGPNAADRSAVSPRTVVAGLAWPPGPDRLVELLAAWAPAMDTAVHLVHVRSPSAPELYVGRVTGRRAPDHPDLETFSARLRQKNVAVDIHQITGSDPVRALLDIADRTGPRTMFAVETHRDSSGDGHHDVTYQLIRQSPYPVLATTGAGDLPAM